MHDNVATMTSSPARVSYAEATRGLLRNTVLDAMRELLVERDWSKITLSDVAARAGVSRQTLYNEFGSRTGLSQGYALRLADVFVEHVDAAIEANVGDAENSLRDGLNNFLVDAATDPLIQSLLQGDVKLDLLRLITIDAGILISHASQRLADTFVQSWVRAEPDEAELLARVLVRIALSYVSSPPEGDRDVAADLSVLLSPFVNAVAARRA